MSEGIGDAIGPIISLTLTKALVALMASSCPFHMLAVLKKKAMRKVVMAPTYANPGCRILNHPVLSGSKSLE